MERSSTQHKRSFYRIIQNNKLFIVAILAFPLYFDGSFGAHEAKSARYSWNDERFVCYHHSFLFDKCGLRGILSTVSKFHPAWNTILQLP
jgi:hypothetical protein